MGAGVMKHATLSQANNRPANQTLYRHNARQAPRDNLSPQPHLGELAQMERLLQHVIQNEIYAVDYQLGA